MQIANFDLANGQVSVWVQWLKQQPVEAATLGVQGSKQPVQALVQAIANKFEGSQWGQQQWVVCMRRLGCTRGLATSVGRFARVFRHETNRGSRLCACVCNKHLESMIGLQHVSTRRSESCTQSHLNSPFFRFEADGRAIYNYMSCFN